MKGQRSRSVGVGVTLLAILVGGAGDDSLSSVGGAAASVAGAKSPPLMRRPAARLYAKRALYHRIRGYRGGSGKRFSCRQRVNRSTVRCFAAWVNDGTLFYYAKVVVHRYRHRRGVRWWARYKVDRIDNRCYRVRHRSLRRCSDWAWGTYRSG